ncbi:GtrA family protein [Curvivirga aplysinae]|uniref:GtrA family protein n=1 Tax=Curvivirga aplysinae TaxID=2529852 RepID=UPI0012BCD6CE|nr:GtrA family protein [Curvivirga aplysinae]MTI09485.1 hypothetical protein [Curvivirga aplysinae]
MRHEIVGFLIVGGVAFFIDTGFLQFFIYLGLGPYWGRAISFTMALISSWWG